MECPKWTVKFHCQEHDYPLFEGKHTYSGNGRGHLEGFFFWSPIGF